MGFFGFGKKEEKRVYTKEELMNMEYFSTGDGGTERIGVMEQKMMTMDG